jgi:hypothetical protein
LTYHLAAKLLSVGRRFAEIPTVSHEIQCLEDIHTSNKLEPREGFMVDIEVGGRNITIVRNGKLLNRSSFDRQLDNGVIRVPFDADRTKFFIYMKPNPMLTAGKELDEKVKQMLDDFVKKTDLDAPKIDTDYNVLHPVLKGTTESGATITEEPKVRLLL